MSKTAVECPRLQTVRGVCVGQCPNNTSSVWSTATIGEEYKCFVFWNSKNLPAECFPLLFRPTRKPMASTVWDIIWILAVRADQLELINPGRTWLYIWCKRRFKPEQHTLGTLRSGRFSRHADFERFDWFISYGITGESTWLIPKYNKTTEDKRVFDLNWELKLYENHKHNRCSDKTDITVSIPVGFIRKGEEGYYESSCIDAYVGSVIQFTDSGLTTVCNPSAEISSLAFCVTIRFTVPFPLTPS